MISDVERNQTIRFIADRRCASGGYCHYRLDEPNAADTFFALDTLRLLGALAPDPVTDELLLRMQHPDGRYPTFYAGAYALRSLALIGKGPAADPCPWLRSFDPLQGSGERPVESASVFERTCTHLDLCRTLGTHPDELLRDAVLRHLTAYHNPDGGFGRPRSSLIETAHAVAILAMVGEPHGTFGAERFLRRCEDAVFGYLNSPGATPAYLEHLAAGVECAALTGRPLRFPERCRTFVDECRNANGGYSRSIYGGISTLENTRLAIRTLALINQIEHRRDQHDRD
ncbi:hypothetical protein F8E02_11035 [Methanoculleus sp. Wushi-C6]|uniref:Prenyltransferase alpha-alpha toroid domain-containing protein n=1 Tax=Methanoculleus caldifontis TaxID=2651577 RepID=A0ABU3X386_9EURY|nr:hypothetical protein [Methanoculleus sp. Wushi-C6]MDV2482523.1 hypothetical protein [Methanoculleus sp. Wushi-C6]